MSALKHMLSWRTLLPILSAATVFLLTSGTLGGYDGASWAQGNNAPVADPGKPLPGGTPSESDLQTAGANGERQSCKSFTEAKGGFLLGRIVPCLERTIEHAADRMSREMIERFRPLFYAFLTLVITIFGVQVLQNEGQLQSRAFVLLLKIGFCLTILAAIPGDKDTNEGGLIGTAYGIMQESQAVVMGALGPESANIHCHMELFGDANTPLIWKQMDCLLSKLYGFTVGTPGPSGEARPNMLLASSMVGLLGGFFFNSSFGVALFFACIGMLVSMFVLVLKVVVAFLNSYMIIGLYMILAPLLLPLMFLRVTASIFEKWYSGILAAMLLPMIVCAYVVLALQVYDKLFFADDAMIVKLFDNQLMDRARQLPKEACDVNISNTAGFRADATGRSEKDVYTDQLLLNNLNPAVIAANNLCVGAKAANLDLNGTFKDENGNPISGKEAFEKLFFDCIKLFIVSLLINMGFTTIMGSIKPMLGSGSVVLAMSTGLPMEQRFSEGIARAKQGFKEGFEVKDKDGNWQSSSGLDFLRQMPDAFKDGSQGFLRGMGMMGEAAPEKPKDNAGAGKGSGAASKGDGNKAGGDDGGDTGGGGGKAADRGGPNTPPTRQTSVRNLSPAAQLAAMEDSPMKEQAGRLRELQSQLYSDRLDPIARAEMNKEYEALLKELDEVLGRGGE